MPLRSISQIPAEELRHGSTVFVRHDGVFTRGVCMPYGTPTHVRANGRDMPIPVPRRLTNATH